MQQYLEVGKVVAVHGVMGEVRVQPWADSPDFLCQFKTLYVDQNHWPIQVERARVHKNMVIFKFEGVTDVPSGMALRNAILYIDRADAKLPEGSFFIADLMGLEVRSAATGDVCSAIQSMEPGWRGTVQPLSGGVRLSPAWLVTTDTAQYYLDCATGALTRITDQ